MKRSKIMYGGVVNKTRGKSNFESVVQMLIHPGCQIKSISYSSLKGFIFVLHVQNLEPDSVEFYGLNETTNAFDVPVDTLILKMAVLYTGDAEGEINLDMPQYVSIRGETFDKEMDIKSDFYDEAVIQSKIYKQTLSKGQPVCPALVDLSFFSNLESANAFLDAISKKCIADGADNAEHMITYIKSQLNGENRILGMISMESATGFETFQDIFPTLVDESEMETTVTTFTTPPSTHKQMLLCQHAIFNIIRLLNECSLIHCDLHDKNILVKTTADGSMKMFIIDFGRTLRIDDINELNQRVKGKNSFPDLDVPMLNPPFRTEDVSTILEFIKQAELRYNYLFFGSTDESKIRKYYLNPFSGNVPFELIATELNSYYAKLIKCSKPEMNKYKQVSTQVKKLEKTQENFKSLCEVMAEVLPAEPIRIVSTSYPGVESIYIPGNEHPTKKRRLHGGGKKTRKQRKKRTRKLRRRT